MCSKIDSVKKTHIEKNLLNQGLTCINLEASLEQKLTRWNQQDMEWPDFSQVLDYFNYYRIILLLKYK